MPREGYQPTDFSQREDLSPASEKETVVESASIEVKTERSIDQVAAERKEKFGQFFNSLRERAGSFLSSAGKMGERAIFAGPELASAGAQKVSEGASALQQGVEQGFVSFGQKIDEAGKSFEGGIDNAANWASDTQEQFGAYLKEKGDALASAGALAAESVSGQFVTARTELGAAANSAMEWGVRNLARLEKAGRAGWKAFMDARNERKLQALRGEKENIEQKIRLLEGVPA